MFKAKFFAGQIVGLVAMVIMCLSYQRKKSSQVFFMQTVACFLFSVHFLLLEAYTGLVLNAIEVLRGYLLYREDKKWTSSPPVIIGITAMMVVSGILTWEGWYSFFPILAIAVGTPLLWTRKPKTIRYANLCLISPCWIVYNIRVLALFGVITETLNICSIVISLIRYKGFKENENTPTAIAFGEVEKVNK